MTLPRGVRPRHRHSEFRPSPARRLNALVPAADSATAPRRSSRSRTIPRLRRRQDREKRHRLLRRVEDRVHHFLRDERAFARFQTLLLPVDPLLGHPVDYVNDLFARRVVVEAVTGARPHRDAHERQELRPRQRRLRQPPMLAPRGPFHARRLRRDEPKRLLAAAFTGRLLSSVRPAGRRIPSTS